ncbi:DUF4179 domain-containing protein [Sporosarcina sp. FSL K6-1522]|uniref:DUF4179 domain-containing protein n=1 Tax=Sporosarcina sp. FSL K6-1522 TaxID=2921554 RepID=UPI00315B2256
MFDEEEQKLAKWKEEIDKASIADNRLEQAIKEGFQRAKQTTQVKKHPAVKRSIWSIVIAAVLLLTLVTSIRVSPAFANVVASIPGMEKIVAIILDNKGLQLAIANEHYQKIAVSGESSGIRITLEGLITDEDSLVAFYTFEHKKNSPNDFLVGYRILDKNGIEIVGEGGGYSTNWNHESDTKSLNTVEIEFEGAIPTDELILEVQISKEQDVNDVQEVIQLPFRVELNPIQKEQYILNETVHIAGQSMTIKSVTTGPLKTAVEVEFDADNTMEIYGFEDMRLVDDKGDVWSSIQNGVTGTWSEENPNVKTYYLQSNYFEQLGSFTLMFNKLQALEKDEAYIVIDTEKGVILKQPADKRFSVLTMKSNFIKLALKSEKGYNSQTFGDFIDAQGKEVWATSGGFSPISDKRVEISATYPNEAYVNPIKLPLHGYPQWIEGEVKIKLK